MPRRKRTRKSEREKWASPPVIAIVRDENERVLEPADPAERERTLKLEQALSDGNFDETALRDLGILE